MGGFLGIGQSGGEQSSTGNLNNVFSYALPSAEASGTAGSGNLGTAADYFSKLLHAGRTDTAMRSAPATNAVLAQSDAARRAQAISGTGRTGGTAELNSQGGTTTNSNIDNIINQNLMGGQQVGAAGLTQVGGQQLSHAGQLLGIGTQGQDSLYQGAINKEGQASSAFGNLFGGAIQDVTGVGLAKALGII